jgi:hypothetical protein
VLVAEFELLRHVWFPVARLQDLAADAYSIAYRRLYSQLLKAFTPGAANGRRQPRRAPAARVAR